MTAFTFDHAYNDTEDVRDGRRVIGEHWLSWVPQAEEGDTYDVPTLADAVRLYESRLVRPQHQGHLYAVSGDLIDESQTDDGQPELYYCVTVYAA